MKKITKSDLDNLRYDEKIYYFYRGEVTPYYFLGNYVEDNKKIVEVEEFYNIGVKHKFDADFVCKWFYTECSKRDILEYKYISLKLELDYVKKEMKKLNLKVDTSWLK